MVDAGPEPTYEEEMRVSPLGLRVCLQFVIVVFPDHTHLLFCPFLGGLRFGISIPDYFFLGGGRVRK